MGRMDRKWTGYVLSVTLVAALTLAGFRIEASMARTNLAMLYLLVVVVSALRWGQGPAIVTAVSSALVFDFYFIPPFRSFEASDIWYLITSSTLLVVGIVIGRLASEARSQAREARKREAYTAALYSLSQSVSVARNLDSILEALARHIRDVFGLPVAVLLPEDGVLTLRHSSADFGFAESERPLAVWAFEHGDKAGRGTTRLPGFQAQYLPLKTGWGVEGVLGIKAHEAMNWLPAEQQLLLEVMASRAALVIERALLEEQAQRAQVIEQTSRLQKALLNSISHNLRTPLASIVGTLSSLVEDRALLGEVTQRELLEAAQEQAARLNRLVGNLLDMTRLEAGGMRVKTEACDVEDLVGAALAQLGEAGRLERISVRIPPELALAPMDFVLIAQALVNLVDNAIKYSPPEEPIEIEVRAEGEHIEISVSDRGVGIREDELERAFAKFYRGARTDGTGGTGLGLSIAKGFVEAHGGRIWAERRDGGGTTIRFTLPLGAHRDQPRGAIDERSRAASARS